MGQDKSPFEEGKASGDKTEESEYDFAEVHRYDDVMVKLGEASDSKLISWSPPNVASHAGVAGKSQTFKFQMDSKVYQEALRHPDLNRGVRLMSGDPVFPLFVCWLRPLSIHGETAYFVVKVPLDRQKDMYIAFIPEEGKKRYLHNLDEVALYFRNRSEAQGE
ncbi:hypothetical protein JIN84_03260 [Luteolibacter yonseiensis]|uniref:Uncharacterized protein n=2 Tax=Luteolibacter yonseiensis TaxID=1144680 RepID=A0A934R3H3_9BACT|nr:hypothetical protein [Luteolibacter yonseiensis]